MSKRRIVGVMLGAGLLLANEGARQESPLVGVGLIGALICAVLSVFIITPKWTVWCGAIFVIVFSILAVLLPVVRC